MDDFTSLSGQLLVSLPSMKGDYFKQTVILLIEHNLDGAFGLVVNRPIQSNLGELLKKQEEFDVKEDFQQEVPLSCWRLSLLV